MVTILFLSPTSDDILVSGNYEKANETHITDTPHRSSHQSKKKKKKVHKHVDIPETKDEITLQLANGSIINQSPKSLM